MDDFKYYVAKSKVVSQCVRPIYADIYICYMFGKCHEKCYYNLAQFIGMSIPNRAWSTIGPATKGLEWNGIESNPNSYPSLGSPVVASLPLPFRSSVARCCGLAPNWCNFIAHGVQTFPCWLSVQFMYLVLPVICSEIKGNVLSHTENMFLSSTLFCYVVVVSLILDACGCGP